MQPNVTAVDIRAGLILGSVLLLPGMYLVWSTVALSRAESTLIKWKRECCATGLVLGAFSWLCASLMIILAIAGSENGVLFFIVVGLGIFVLPYELVMGVVVRARPGDLLTRAALAQVFYWMIFWAMLPRGVL